MVKLNDRYHTKRHPIRLVARRTGLTRDVIRAWEIRYGAVEPRRTPGGQRLYSDADIERLRLMQQVLEGGRRIGQVAGLTTDELENLVNEDIQALSTSVRANGSASQQKLAQPFLLEALEAVKSMNAERLEASLSRAALTLPAADLMENVVTPLMVEIGDLWRHERLTPGHERIATTVVRRTLDSIRVSMKNSRGPGLVVATPSGQHHEIGAMLAAAAAAGAGWRVLYMGADLPGASIAAAAKATGARAVALSLTFPADDLSLADELRSLRRLLPDDVSVIVGGQAAVSYKPVLDEIGALWLPDGPSLHSALELMLAAGTNGRSRD